MVFLAIGLPGLDGFAVARALCADRSIRQPTLVALTCWGTAEDRRRALESCCKRDLVNSVDAARVTGVVRGGVIPSR